MKKIYMFAGHMIGDGVDNGATSRFGVESVEARKLVTEVAKRLYLVHNIMTITDQDNWTLSKVIRWFKTKMAPGVLMVDVHFNAYNGTAHGTEVLVPTRNTPTEIAIANRLQKAICNALGTKSRGIKTEADSHHGRLGILYRPAVANNILLEVCFIDNAGDMTKYRENFQQLVENLASAISKSVK